MRTRSLRTRRRHAFTHLRLLSSATSSVRNSRCSLRSQVLQGKLEQALSHSAQVQSRNATLTTLAQTRDAENGFLKEALQKAEDSISNLKLRSKRDAESMAKVQTELDETREQRGEYKSEFPLRLLHALAG